MLLRRAAEEHLCDCGLLDPQIVPFHVPWLFSDRPDLMNYLTRTAAEFPYIGMAAKITLPWVLFLQLPFPIFPLYFIIWNKTTDTNYLPKW